jgi:hypothetical protein
MPTPRVYHLAVGPRIAARRVRRVSSSAWRVGLHFLPGFTPSAFQRATPLAERRCASHSERASTALPQNETGRRKRRPVSFCM